MMTKMIKDLYVFLILVALISCLNTTSSVNAYTFTVVSRDDPYATYALGTKFCIYTYNILLEGQVGVELSITGATVAINSKVLVSKSPGKVLYRINLQVDQAGSTFNFLVSENSVSNNEPVSYSCEEPPVPTFELITPNLNFNTGIYWYSSPYLFFKISNLVKPIAPEVRLDFVTPSNTYQYISTASIGNNTYKAIMAFSQGTWSDMASDVSIKLAYSGSTTQYSLPIVGSFLKGKNINLNGISISTYPSNYKTQLLTELSSFITTTRDPTQSPFLMLKDVPQVSPQNPLLLFQNKTIPNNIEEMFYVSTIPSSLGSTTFTMVHMSEDTLKFESDAANWQYVQQPISYTNEQSNFNLSINTFSSRIDGLTNIVQYIMVGSYSGTASVSQQSPFGLLEGNSNSYSIQVDLIPGTYSPDLAITYSYMGPEHRYTLSPPSVDNTAPWINSLTEKYIGNYLIVEMNIMDDISGFKDIIGLGSYKDIVSGSLTNGIFEFILEKSGFQAIFYSNFGVYDQVANNFFFPYSSVVTTSLQRFNNSVLNFDLIKNVTFQYNVLDVTNEAKNNTMFVYYPSEYKNIVPQIIQYDQIKRFSPIITAGFYDEAIGAFTFDFYIHKNSISGPIIFQMFMGPVMFLSPELKTLFGPQAEFIIESEVGDNTPAMVDDIQFSPGQSVIVESGADVNITWTITIQTRLQDFANGSIHIQSSLDLVIYIFDFSPSTHHFVSGDLRRGVYKFTLPVSGRCKSQSFNLYNVLLYTKDGYTSLYQSAFSIQLQNPIAKYMSDPKALTSITTTCNHPATDLTPPQLVSFDFNPKIVDVTYSGVLNQTNPRLVTFDFEAFDESGIMLSALPVVYITDITYQPTPKTARLVSFNETYAKYQCQFLIPYGYGFGGRIMVSLYGIVDNQSNFKGYPSSTLPYGSIDVVPTINMNISIISTSELGINGGDLYVFGRQFKVTDKIMIQDKDYNTVEMLSVIDNTNSVLLSKANPYNMEFIYVTMQRDLGNSEIQYSNTFKVFLKGYVPPPEPSSSSSDNNLSSDSNIPTNSPQSCLNQCSGNGECTPNGCVCKSPYVGLDCSSQVIIVPPKINNTIPESNFIIPPSSNNKNEVFYAIISVVALNEVDKDSNVLNRYSFNQWIVSNNTDSKYKDYTNSIGFIYTASLTNNNDKSVTNLSVSIDYFNINEAINITFANQQLQMNPHSLKYSINITNYSFESSLNSLQLVLSASIESDNSNDDECSSKQTGDVVDSESEFIKMQIDQTSLYGRFIKRGVIDNRVKYVTNTLLDSEYNAIETTSKSQTYIGINIPFYSKLAQLDPDFSILVDNKPASDNDNAICGARKSKLTGAQIAGIAIGCAAFVGIIITSTVYYFYKRNQTKKLHSQIAKKMESIK